jgi:tetratricopeptide (TPR) repeat protein
MLKRVNVFLREYSMGLKFALFAVLTALTRNPLLAILLVLILYYILDLRYFGVSRLLFKNIRTGTKIRDLQREVSLNPHNASALNDLGRLLILSKRYREAVPYLERAIERLEDTAETNYYLGLAYLHAGNPKSGEERILKAIELNPLLRYGEPYLMLGEYHFNQGQYERALIMLRRFHEIHSSSVEGFYYLGQAYQKLVDNDRALESYQEAIKAFHRSPYYKRREDRKWVWKTRIAVRRLRGPVR